MLRGFMYLVAIMDWYSRYVVTWQLSNTLDGLFCLEALDQALAQAQPEIFNTDQGAQFTALEFTSRLEAAEVRISMDGRGRALDNVFVERLWRSAKYEHLYLYEHASVPEREKGLEQPFTFCSHERPLQSLSYRTPTQARYTSESYPKWL
jgi:putative transposase